MKNLIISGIFACLLGFAGISKAQVFQCDTPVFSHGPSLALTEISPKNIHPFSVAEGAGYFANVGICQYVLNGKSYDLLDFNVMALGSVTSPDGVTSGALQVGGGIGTFNNFIAFDVLSTPYTASGGGYLQGASPGTAFALVLSVPLNFGPTSPPVGIPSEGANAYPRGLTLNLP